MGVVQGEVTWTILTRDAGYSLTAFPPAPQGRLCPPLRSAIVRCLVQGFSYCITVSPIFVWVLAIFCLYFKNSPGHNITIKSFCCCVLKCSQKMYNNMVGRKISLTKAKSLITEKTRHPRQKGHTWLSAREEQSQQVCALSGLLREKRHLGESP